MMPGTIFMSRILAAVLLAAGAVVGSSSKPQGFGQRPAPWIKYDVPRDFANPSGLARPTFRYWVPDADVDDDILYADLKNIHDAGWGSVEVICLENYGIELAVVDPAEFGYGGLKWTRRFQTMLRAAENLNMTVDFALGPTQGASIPILDPDSEGMNTELAYGQVNITSGSTFSASLPPPDQTYAGYANTPDFIAPFQNYTNKFVAAVVARKSATPSKDHRVTALDFASVHEVTSLVHNGSLTWTAPDDGNEYVLLTFYQRRTGYLAAQGAFDNATDPDNPASWFAYVVDHFSQAGTDLWTGFTEQYVMNGENGELLRQLGLYAWEDSAEFRATLFWTDGFADFFNRTRGYDIVPVLPILFGTTGVPPSTLTNGYFYFSYDQEGSGNGTAAIDWKIRNDFYQALQELYETYHLDGLSQWSAGWGLQGSVQPYATAPNRAPPWDMVSAAAHIDAPETESNYFDGVVDAFRAMGGGAAMGRRQVYSSELGAHRYFAYAATWPLVLADCALSYAGGVNRVVHHGYPYTGRRPGVEWPGLTAFEWTYSEMWGPRQPSWAYAREMADWIARTQLVLQSGVPRIDVGIYRHKYLSVDIKHYGMGENIFGDESLQNAGYSYASVSPSLLNQDNAIITNGVLAEDGPAFAAFIIDNSTNITAPAVTRLLEYAEQDFPILFVGELPRASPYYSAEADAHVQRGVQALLARPSVRHLRAEADVVPALRGLGVAPAAETLDGPCPILYAHRWDADGAVDYYWAWNADRSRRHATRASLRGRGLPYALDAWTGIVAPIVNYTRVAGGGDGDGDDDARVTVWLDLRANQSTIVALAPEGFFPAAAVPRAHVVASSGGVEHLSVSPDGTYLVARSTSSPSDGSGAPFGLVLSDGRNLTLPSTNGSAPPLAPPVELGPWNLTVQDWRPGPDPFADYAPVFVYHHLVLEELVPWYNLTGLEDVSGVGTYTTEFVWPPDDNNNNSSSSSSSSNSSSASGALLDLGPVLNTVRLWVNGQWTGPIDVWDAVVDIGPYLVDGANSVRVETSSTLRNRLLQVNVTQSWEEAKYSSTYGGQPYGLVAPVTLIPYWETRIPL